MVRFDNLYGYAVENIAKHKKGIFLLIPVARDTLNLNMINFKLHMNFFLDLTSQLLNAVKLKHMFEEPLQSYNLYLLQL